MDYQAHVVGGVGLAFGIAYLTKMDNIDTIVFCTTSAIGSILPDIDTPKSFLGRRLRPLSSLIHQIFGHRTITHSIITVTVLLEICLYKWGFKWLIIGTFLGAVSHIFLDMLTVQGVEILYPLNKKRFKLLK